VFWVKCKLGLVGASLFTFLLACGKLPERPPLPGTSPRNEPELILLGRDLTVRDLRALVRVLNHQGEFQALSQWTENLSDSDLEAWVQWVNRWVFQDAQKPTGLVQLLKLKIENFWFSQFKKDLKQVLDASEGGRKVLIDTFSDPAFSRVLKRLSFFLGSKAIQKGHLALPNDEALQELITLFQNENQNPLLKKFIENFLNSNVMFCVPDLSKQVLQKSGDQGIKELAKTVSENTDAFRQALELAALLNRPAEKVISVLQDGLKNNSDIVHTLSQRWDPIFVRSLSEIIQKVLVHPEDGKSLDKTFWLHLPRATGASKPNPEFIRLYSIILSGIQKISDPRRFESQTDSGSYRLPMQLNALFLTKLMEELVRNSLVKLGSLPENLFEEKLWSLETSFHVYQFSLVQSENKEALALEVIEDLNALGLSSVKTRLEALLREGDSGKQDYVLTLSQESRKVSEVFSEAVGVAHALKPLSEVTPFLVSLVHHLTGKSENSVSSLELLKASPNILNQLQGVFSQLTHSQWQSLKKTIFEDFKIGQLEIEDRALLVSLFQSDPETAEWVNEVLMRTQSLYVLDQLNASGKGLLGHYQSLLARLNPQEMSSLGSALDFASQLGFFKRTEADKPAFPGLMAVLQNPDGIETALKGFSAFDRLDIQSLRRAMDLALGEDEAGVRGFDEGWDWLTRNVGVQDSKGLTKTLKALASLQFNLSLEDQEWIKDFAQKGGVEALLPLLKPLTQESWASLVGEMKTLSHRKVIQQGMTLLSRIKNERMQEIARVFQLWDHSGEFEECLGIPLLIFKKGEKK